MKRFTVALAAVIAVGAIYFAGCTRQNTLEPSQTDQQYFLDVVSGMDASTNGLAVSDEDALNDNALFTTAQRTLPPSIQSVATSDSIVPQRWGRFVESVSRTITRTTQDGDSAMLVEAQVTFTGHVVIVGTVNGMLDTVRKPYTETLHRYFRFVRVGNSQYPRLNWRPDAVSILNGGTANATITIESLSVITPAGDTLVASDPDNYYMQIAHGWMRHWMPVWSTAVRATVIATVHSAEADTDIVTLHYVPRDFGLHRAAMSMTSQLAEPAGGYLRTYATTVTLPALVNRAYAHVILSATTRGSLYSADSTDFNSAVWGVPYKAAQ